MSKGIDELKDWAMHNVRLISILPSNKILRVDTKLYDVLEQDVDEKYYLSEERTEQLLKEFPRDLPNGVDGFNKADGDVSLTAQDRHGIAIREATKKGFAEAHEGDSVNYQFPTSETRRGRVGKQLANTLEASGVNQGVVINPLKDKTNNGWHFEQQVYDPKGITRAVKAGGGSGNIPKTILPKEEQVVVLGGIYTKSSKNFQRPPLKGLSRTLKANNHDAGITDGLRIRKLTPLECWRLQGFTDEQFYKAKNDGVSNSQLYKQAGNSVTVNVIDAIARKLV